MELLFKVNDETKLGKIIIDMIQSAIKQDKSAVQVVKEDFMEQLIFPGKPFTDEEFDKMTLAMEDEGNYIPLEKSKKETLALLKKKGNENRNQKKS